MPSPEADAEILEMMNLNQKFYTMVEIAFMLKRGIRTVRALKDKQSQRDPSRKLLVAEKAGGIWRVTREDFIYYLQETYGGKA